MLKNWSHYLCNWSNSIEFRQTYRPFFDDFSQMLIAYYKTEHIALAKKKDRHVGIILNRCFIQCYVPCPRNNYIYSIKNILQDELYIYNISRLQEIN